MDGDQLNTIVNPLFVEIAERNVKEFDIVPLFYEAEKAHAEPINNESLFKGLKRAHEYSNIGEISNMLTRLWNKDKPDKVVAALLTYLNNLRIDGAKTGIVHEYKDYPLIAKRIGKATGGKNGRMPYWFQFSKNQRSKEKEKVKYAEPNNSTMNRICKAFSDIGNINLNYAGIPQFNWEMLLSAPCIASRIEIPEMFCEMDQANKASVIESQENAYSNEKQLINGYAIVAEDITRRMTEEFGSLEAAYPYVAKYLFAGEGQSKAAHKQMFWRVFGDIALANLKHNLQNCDTCPECNIKVPSWVKNHVCIKNTQGFYQCIDCGAMCERTSSTQCRCKECQEVYRRSQKKLRRRQRQVQRKESDEQRITRLMLSLTET